MRKTLSRYGTAGYSEYSHLHASQAATLLTTELYTLMRGMARGRCSKVVRELQQGAEAIAIKVAQWPADGAVTGRSRQAGDVRVVMAEFEACLLVARSLGHLTDTQLQRLDVFLRYIRSYCAGSDGSGRWRLAGTPNA